jgi:hypothetical protein
MGIVISTGPISAWLTGAYPQWQQEKQSIVEAGLESSAWQHMNRTQTESRQSLTVIYGSSFA